MRLQIKQLFSFSKRERRALGVILLIQALLVAISGLHDWLSPNLSPKWEEVNWSGTPEIILEHQPKHQRFRTAPPIGEDESVKTKSFNPNLAGPEMWQKAGLSAKQAMAVIRYRERAGGFKTKGQVLALGVLTGRNRAQLENQLLLETPTGTEPEQRKNPPLPKTHRPKPLLDLNLADSMALVDLPGIGPKLAARIIAYRDKLGGFYKVNQLREVYGLADSTYQKLEAELTVGQQEIKIIRPVKENFKALAAHPYIRYSKAKLLCKIIETHGLPAAWPELQSYFPPNDSLEEKARPYLGY